MIQPILYIALLFLTCFITGLASAQSTSSVSGPSVRENESAAEYRLGITDEKSGSANTFAHRFSYDKALSERFRLRGLLQFTDPDGSGFGFAHIEADALWQIIKPTPSGYASALRLDYRIRQNGADQIGLNWINEWMLDDGWRIRWMGLIDRQIEDAAPDGLILESRSSFSKDMGNYRIGLSSYNNFGNTDTGFGAFKDQRHQVGPTIESEFAPGLKWTVGAIAGLSESAPDAVFQFRLENDLSPIK